MGNVSVCVEAHMGGEATGLPFVAKLKGVAARPSLAGSPPAVSMQYTDPKGVWYELAIPVDEAVLLVAQLQLLLEKIERRRKP